MRRYQSSKYKRGRCSCGLISKSKALFLISEIKKPEILLKPSFPHRLRALPAPSPHAVDVPFEVAASNELSKHMLCEDRHCAGIERNLLLQGRAELRGQNHVTHANSWDTFFGFKREKRVFSLGGHGELGVKIILNDEFIFCRRPANVARPPGSRCGDSARIAVERRDMQDCGVGLFQRAEPYALAVHRQHAAADAAG